MSKRIAPKPRNAPLTTFYALGEFQKPKIRQFSVPVADAVIYKQQLSSNILQRNPHHTETLQIKHQNPSPLRSSAYQTRFFNDKSKEMLLTQQPSNWATVKQIQSRQYADQSMEMPQNLSQTVNKEAFSRIKTAPNSPGIQKPANQQWNFITKQQQVIQSYKRKNTSSEDAPDWFQTHKSQTVQNADVRKAEGFDGTMTLISRINGWITVSPDNKAEKIGKNGPFNQNSNKRNFRHVSDLSPAWMQTHYREHGNKITKGNGFALLRKEQKRTFLLDNEQPEKSLFSIGDFRHNVTTQEETAKYQQGICAKAKNFLEWKEDSSKQSYDKPITSKIC